MSIREHALEFAPLWAWIELNKVNDGKSYRQIYAMTNKQYASISTRNKWKHRPSNPVFLCSYRNGFTLKRKRCGKMRGNRRWSHIWCWILLFLLLRAAGPQAKWNDITIAQMDVWKNWNPFQPSSQTNKLNACMSPDRERERKKNLLIWFHEIFMLTAKPETEWKCTKKKEKKFNKPQKHSVKNDPSEMLKME